MRADDIFFEKDGEKKLVATLGNSSGKSVNIDTDDGLYKLRLVSPTEKGALPIHVKIKGNIYALGSFPDGICVKSNEYYSSISFSDYNKSYIYDITNSNIKLIATVPCSVVNGYYIKEQNLYILIGYYRTSTTWQVTRDTRLYISFNGYDWKESNIGEIYDIIYKDGKVSVLTRKLISYDSSTHNSYYDIYLYSIEDADIQLVKELTGAYFPRYDYIITDFDGNRFYVETKNGSSSYYVIRYNHNDPENISKNEIPSINSTRKNEYTERNFDYTKLISSIKQLVTAEQYELNVVKNELSLVIYKKDSVDNSYSFKIKAICDDSVFFKCTGKLTSSNYGIMFTNFTDDYYYLINGNTVTTIGDIPAFYRSRIDGKAKAVIYRDKQIKIVNSDGTVEKSVAADGNTDRYINVFAFCTAIDYTVSDVNINTGTYTIEDFFSQLSNYIAENSYRVLASGFIITDGNFTVSMAAGQRIWLCSEGESPNYTKAIRFVDDDNDYSGYTPDYTGGSQNYNFYGDGSTGFAKVYKAKGRYGTYVDVPSYNVEITGDISFI